MIFKNSWLTLAAASGACAAFNGVFAKLYLSLPTSSLRSPLPRGVETLGVAYIANRQTPPPLRVQNSTTTELTSSWSRTTSSFLGIDPSNKSIEFFIRAVTLPLPIFSPNPPTQLTSPSPLPLPISAGESPPRRLSPGGGGEKGEEEKN